MTKYKIQKALKNYNNGERNMLIARSCIMSAFNIQKCCNTIFKR